MTKPGPREGPNNGRSLVGGSPGVGLGEQVRRERQPGRRRRVQERRTELVDRVARNGAKTREQVEAVASGAAQQTLRRVAARRGLPGGRHCADGRVDNSDVDRREDAGEVEEVL